MRVSAVTNGKQHRVSPLMTSRARQLRRGATFPERLLWSKLRGSNWPGVRFRRQHVIGKYVTDFCCPKCRLVIELDGHSHLGCAATDREREHVLRRRGYHVLRFTNDDVLRDIRRVLETIENAVHIWLDRIVSPPPYPPPERGRGRRAFPSGHGS